MSPLNPDVPLVCLHFFGMFPLTILFTSNYFQKRFGLGLNLGCTVLRLLMTLFSLLSSAVVSEQTK